MRTLALWTLAASLVLGYGISAGAEADSLAARFEVEKFIDVPYYEGADAHPVRHKLDLFLPKGQKDYPVLMIVHGGVWIGGDKSYHDCYSAVGRCFASLGIGAVLPNYRLSPGVRHPEHVRDVARAFAWTHQNIGRYGGRADRIFLCGHSAGGHLTSLLAMDDRYLKEVGLDRKEIRGVINASGVYFIPDFNLNLNVAFNIGDFKLGNDGVEMNWAPLRMVFGTDPKVRKEAAPINHIKPGLPPFLVMYAERDLPTFPKQAREFAAALKEAGCEVELYEGRYRTHWSLLFAATTPNDPVVRKLIAFIDKHR